MDTLASRAFFITVLSTRAWLLFGCHFLWGAPFHAEIVRGFDGVELMSSGEDAAYHRQETLDRHNYLRSREAENGFGGGAVFMNRLVYDVELEAYARNYARHLCATGKWEHSQRQAPLRVARGENLYTTSADYSSVPSRSFDSAKIVQKWWEEREYFDWHSSHPSQAAQRQGKLVGHWTQVVRAEASTVGCWIVTGCHCKGGYCGKQNGGKWSTYMACHYDYGNAGYYPYWPLNPNIQYRIPSSVPSRRRQRCGNCPKGFSACGTTAGGGQKRDAYLCVGYWQIRGALPPPDLLQRSIQVRHSSSGVPSWYYMVRNCVASNGSCPTNSSCWKYDGGRLLTREPAVLVNQCQCSGFSTRAGIYFERDFCGRYSAIQPYYDADAFLGFSELKVERSTDADTSALPATSTMLTYNREIPAKLRRRYRRAMPSEIEIGNAYDYDTLAVTPPLAEEAEAADLIKKTDTATSAQASVNTSAAPQHTHSLEQDVLLEEDANAVLPPSDDLMFEWRGVTSPLSIARQPGADAGAGGDKDTGNVGARLQSINLHSTKSDFVQVNVSQSPEELQAEDSADDSYTVGTADTSVDENQTGHGAETDTETHQPFQEPDQNGIGQENLVAIPEGELEDHPSTSSGAPVDVPAVQLDARNRQMTPLDPSTAAASPAGQAETSEPSDHYDEAETPPTLDAGESTPASWAEEATPTPAVEESTPTETADDSPKEDSSVEAP